LRKFFYGWVIVAACTALLFMQAGIVSSFGVFFKPLTIDLNASRTAISSIDLVYKILNAISFIIFGLILDRVKPQKVSLVINFTLGLAFVLTSFTTGLWQIFFSYSLLMAIGSQNTVIGTTTVSRWFTSHRGTALGIISAGVGLGTLVMPPISGQLIESFGWSKAYLFLGLAVWLISMPVSQLLKPGPLHKISEKTEPTQKEPAAPKKSFFSTLSGGKHSSLKASLLTRTFLMLVVVYLTYSFCSQMVMVHLVNHATDTGISPIVAATLLSVLGLGSTLGRLIMGALADRVDSVVNLMISGILVMLSFVLLIFARELYMFYIFAFVFGFAYGGEVPQLSLLIIKYFGEKSLGTLSGILLAVTAIGSGTGSMIGGVVFDITKSYVTVFLIGIIITFIAVVVLYLLKKSDRKNQPDGL
jgi:MFS family permease